jgi:hypothetical protein
MNEDEDVSDEITKIFREDGITVLTGTSSQQVEPLASGRIQLTVPLRVNSSSAAHICWRQSVASRTLKLSSPQLLAFIWTTKATSR